MTGAWARAGALFGAAMIVGATVRCGGKPPERPAAVPVLSIGLIPEQNIFAQMRRYEPLARYLGQRAGVRVDLHPLARYGNIIENFRAAELDGAFFGSFTYTLAHEVLGVEPVARPERMDGSSTYFGIVIVRRDSGILEAKDLKGKRFAFVDRATTAGYLLPLDFLARAGIRDYHVFFREFYFAGTHEDVINDVLEGKADAGAAKNTVFDRLAAERPEISRDLAILTRSPEVPENALALRTTLDAGLRERIKQALLSMDSDPEGREVLKGFGARRFVETRHADYEPVYRYALEVGMDLGHYAYENR